MKGAIKVSPQVTTKVIKSDADIKSLPAIFKEASCSIDAEVNHILKQANYATDMGQAGGVSGGILGSMIGAGMGGVAGGIGGYFGKPKEQRSFSDAMSGA